MIRFQEFVPIYWSDNSLYKPFAFFAEGDWNPHHSAPGTAWLVPLAPLLLLHLSISEFQIENPPLSFPRNIRKVSLSIHKTQENPKRSFEEDTLPVAFTENCLPVDTLYVEQIHATMEFKQYDGASPREKILPLQLPLSNSSWKLYLKPCWISSLYHNVKYSNMNLHVYLQLYIQYILYVCI